MTTAAVVVSPPTTPQRRARVPPPTSSSATTASPNATSSASWSRATRHTLAMVQRQRNRTRSQANISSHVLGFRRNRTWRQAFLPARTPSSGSSSSSTTDASASSTPTSSSSHSSSSFSASFFRLGRRALTHPSSSALNQTDNDNCESSCTKPTASTTATTTSSTSECKEESIDALLHLLKALRSHDPSVQQVVLDSTALPWQYTAALLRAVGDSPHVWRVQLRKVGADHRIAAALQQCVQTAPALIDLDLSKNQLGYACMQALQVGWQARAESMKMAENRSNKNKEAPISTLGCCPLQRLNLEGNRLDVHAMHVLSQALTTGATPNLQILKLGRCGLRTCGTGGAITSGEGIDVLCRELLASPQCPVTWLDLRGNVLGDVGVWPLAQALTEPNCPLEYLSLQRNGISNEGVAALAQAMEVNTRLRTLDLQRNPDLTNQGAAALVEALWHNHSFTKLKIRHTRVQDMQVKNELFDLLVMNSYGPTLAASTKQALQRLQAEQGSGATPQVESAAPCVICYEANRTAGHTFGILLPCRHDNACWACCQRLRGHCHMCRSAIVKVVAA